MSNHALTLLAASLLLAPASSAATASSEPLGFTRQTIEPGRQTVGVTLNNPVLQSALVFANTATTLELDLAPAALARSLATGRAHYVEIVAGLDDSLAGDRFDVDVAATLAAGGAVLHLKDAPHNSTSLPLPADVLAGHRVILREHLTIARVFGTGGTTRFKSAPRHDRADQLLFYNRVSGGFSTYYLCGDESGPRAGWRKVGAFGSHDDAIIPPGTGLFLQRNGDSSVELTLLGAVRTNDFVMPLADGYNFVASPYPVASSPAGLAMSAANGFAAATGSDGADQILAYNGADFDVFFLHRPGAPAHEEWRRQDGGAESFSTAELLAHSRSVFVKKVGADPDFVARRAFGL